MPRQRPLLRDLAWALPSGQAIAREMGTPVLAGRDFAELPAGACGLGVGGGSWPKPCSACCGPTRLDPAPAGWGADAPEA